MSGEELRILARWALLTGGAVAVLFSVFPHIDLWVAGLFFDGSAFDFAASGTAIKLRHMSQQIVVMFYALVVIACIVSAVSRAPVLKLNTSRWFFLILCTVLGPGLLTNAILKDNWGRPRPRQVEEFGGPFEFTPVFEWTNQCAKNCSFVSGETSSYFMLFFSLALLMPGKARKWGYGLALFMGAMMSWVRIGFGAHFLSDTIMACVFMTFVACGLYWLMFLRDPERARP